jgi:hypothetical protein
VPAGSRRQDRSAFDDESKSAHGRQVDKQCGWKAGAMRRGTLTQLGALSSPSLCSPIVWAVPPLSRMRFATPNGVSLTGASPPRRCSAQESEGEESKTGERISVDSDRPSHGRVRFAAPHYSAPLTAARRSSQMVIATSGFRREHETQARKTRKTKTWSLKLDKVAPYQFSVGLSIRSMTTAVTGPFFD